MTWAELNQAVIDLLSYDGERAKHLPFFKQQIRFAALELQSLIDAYKIGHESTVYESGMTFDGHAAAIYLPEGAEVKEVWLMPIRKFESLLTGSSMKIPLAEGQPEAIALQMQVWLKGAAGDIVSLSFDEEVGDELDTFTLTESGTWTLVTLDISTAASSLRTELCLRGDGATLDVSEADISGSYQESYNFGETACERTQNRVKAQWFPWERRAEFVCGDVPAGPPARYTFNKRTRELQVFPAPTLADGGAIIYKWDGKKLDFADEDIVPFDEACINALFFYTRSQMLTMIDNEPTEGWKLMNSYKDQRTALFADANK